MKYDTPLMEIVELELEKAVITESLGDGDGTVEYPDGWENL